MTNKTSNNIHQHGGFSLVEVLVALLVLAIGLLGMAMLQTTSLRFNTNSHSRTEATYLAYDIIDRMRANNSAFTAGYYDVASSGAAATIVGSTNYTCNDPNNNNCPCDPAITSYPGCSKQQLAAQDLGQWYYRLDKFLPGATLAANSSQYCTNPNGIQSSRAIIQRVGTIAYVTICWFEQEAGSGTTTTYLKSQTWQVEL